MDQWERLEQLGTGGNSVVWRARRGEAVCALKVLNSRDPDDESYQRFSREAELLKRLSGRRGVMPLIDAHVPLNPTRSDRAWIAMPVATGVRQALGPQPSLEAVVEAVQAIAATLASLSDEGISHRDLKPENLFNIDGEWVLGDFGLAKDANCEAITEDGRALGARFYVAPEMQTSPSTSDGRCADVYSLAKVLWVLASGQNFPPPGHQVETYFPNTLVAITNVEKAQILDALIDRATRYAPAERPTMAMLSDELRGWLASDERSQRESDIVRTIQVPAELAGLLQQRTARPALLKKRAEDLLSSVGKAQLESVAADLHVPGMGGGGYQIRGDVRGPSDAWAASHSKVWRVPEPLTHVLDVSLAVHLRNDYLSMELVAAVNLYKNMAEAPLFSYRNSKIVDAESPQAADWLSNLCHQARGQIAEALRALSSHLKSE